MTGVLVILTIIFFGIVLSSLYVPYTRGWDETPVQAWEYDDVESR